MLHSFTEKQFNGHLHTLQGRMQGTEGQTVLGAPGLLEHLHGGCNIRLSHLLLWAAGSLAMLCVMTRCGHHPGLDVTTAWLY